MKTIDGTITLDDLKRMAMINIRPSQGNRSRGVDNPEIREKIVQLIQERITS